MLKLVAAAMTLVTGIFLLLFGAVAWIATGWALIFLPCLILSATLLFAAASIYLSARNALLTPHDQTE